MRNKKRHTVQCDPEKVRARREKLGVTQDKLAAMSKVDKRTIQRLEAGVPICLETLADVAAALRVTPDDIMAASSNGDENPSGTKDSYSQILRRVTSAKGLRDLVRSSTLTKLECQIEPTSENLPVLRKVITCLESMMPAFRGDGWYVGREITSLVDELEEIANLAEYMKEMQATGIAMFVNYTFDHAILPVFSHESDALVVSRGA